MNHEFADKMKEARKLEKEAFMLLLPENIRGHVEVIEKEMKAILRESVSDCIKECLGDKGNQTDGQESSKSKINKVEIV
jgi:hypothetical protein